MLYDMVETLSQNDYKKLQYLLEIMIINQININFLQEVILLN